ncbi:hypothetical protein CVIRNUC_007945 [Coccomyxa viridis]|uniref:Inositol-pentakisphosphate 2-kinase n=1 Tax=Coccomyxa viridis TaxID=1274662 RepID=A0AAV1IBI4_9CHLO|nr:hypothetical protein CVIRNUC_007945 [Coccomyxa viridis]
MSIVDLGAAASWKLKGQGNANAVFEYIGTDADKAGQVLRVRKQKLLLDTHSDTPTELQLLEREIWGSLINDWSSEAIVQQQYEDRVLKPLLGSDFIYQDRHIQLTPEYAAALSQLHQLQLARQAWLEHDHTVFPGPVHATPGNEGTRVCTICVELKPKCGFLPTSACIHPKHAIKREIPRFQLHQHLKCAQGKVQRHSAYNPLDLFSGDVARMQRALRALLRDPQNNLRLFVDGVQAAPGRLEHQLAEISAPQGGIEPFLEHLAITLQHAGILELVLAAQKLDAHDVEDFSKWTERLPMVHCGTI